jgi:hypothetical protein
MSRNYEVVPSESQSPSPRETHDEIEFAKRTKQRELRTLASLYKQIISSPNNSTRRFLPAKTIIDTSYVCAMAERGIETRGIKQRGEAAHIIPFALNDFGKSDVRCVLLRDGR